MRLNDVFITGVAETAVGKVPGKSSDDLYEDVIVGAAADAGVPLAEVDMLISGNSRVEPYLYHAEVMAERLGIRPETCLTVNTGGSTSVSLLKLAGAMLMSGGARNVIIAKADNLATGMSRDRVVESMATIGHPEFESPQGPTIPSLYALIEQRYLSVHGLDAADIAPVAVTDRYHASLNPAAQYRTPITADDVTGSRLVSDPIRLLECAPVSDGGCAVLLSRRDTAERSAGLVEIRSVGESHRFEHVSQAATLDHTGARESGPIAFASAGLAPSDIDIAMIYDAFAFIQCMQLEDLGFCAPGEGPAFVASGATRLGGQLPVNTHGGVLSHSHAGRPSGLFLIVEAVRQLRGECGDRQADGAETALVHGEGGILASHATSILTAVR
jgi:acetyl-CoA acetyltransferase